MQRYVWLWGWLIFAGISAIWPLVAYSHYPDVVDLWQSDYGGRVSANYMHEPVWYYFVHQPWNLFPWNDLRVRRPRYDLAEGLEIGGERAALDLVLGLGADFDVFLLPGQASPLHAQLYSPGRFSPP